MAFLAVAGAGLFGGGAFGSLAFNAVLGVGMIGLSMWMQSKQKQTGPRLEDLEVKDAPVGSGVPLHYGENAFFLVPIWIKDNKLIERKKTERQGKGGPKVTTYSYYVTGAWIIADNTQKALQKMWMNDKVIIDNTGGSSSATMKGLNYALYLGTETQMPDPTMEASLGVGNTPAYRGAAYIVFNQLPLENAGNMIPQLRAQMISAGDRDIYGPTYTHPTPVYSGTREAVYDYSTGRHVIEVQRQSPYTIRRYDIISGELTAEVTQTNGSLDNLNPYATDSYGHLYIYGSTGGIEVYDSQTLSHLFTIPMPGYTGPDGMRRFKGRDGEWMVTWNLEDGGPFGSARRRLTSFLASDDLDAGSYLTFNQLYMIGDSFWWVTETGSLLSSMTSLCAVDYNDCMWVTRRGYDHMMIYKLGLSGYEYWYAVDPLLGKIGAEYDITPATFGMEVLTIGYYPDEDAMVMVGRKYTAGVVDYSKKVIRKYNASTTTGGYFYGPLDLIDEAIVDVLVPVTGTNQSSEWGTQLGVSEQGYRDGYAIWGDVGGNVYKFNLATMSMEIILLAADTTYSTGHGIYLDHLNAMVAWPHSLDGHDPQLIFFNRYAGEGVSLKDIIDDWNSRIGMPTGRNNTDDLAGTFIHGYTLNDQTALTEPLNDIMTVMNVEVADLGAYNKWILRGSQTPFIIDPLDLGATEGLEPAEFDLRINVSEGFELPQIMQLKHYDPEAEFEVSVQEVSRHSAVVASVDISTINTKVVMLKDDAASHLQRLFRAIWRGRTTYEMSLPPKYRKYAPGDVGEITYNDIWHQFIITEITFDDGVVMVRGVNENLTDWTVTATGISTNVPTATVDVLSPPVLHLLNVNAMRDEDVDQLFYVATHAKEPDITYAGAYVLRGAAADTLTDWDAFSDKVKFGKIATAPVNISYPQLLDEASAMRVIIHSSQAFTPASVTVEQLWEDGNLNPMIIVTTAADGSTEVEYLQYATAVAESDQVWVFSDLIRGRRGTEHMIGRAAAGNYVLFPTVSTMYREGEASTVGLLRYYQASTIGETIPNDNPIVSFTNTGKGMRPYSPADLSAVRNTSAALVIDWKRRAKINGNWLEGTEMPLDESVEQYNLYIYTNSSKTTLLRDELIVSASTYTYTLANYNTDTGGAASSIPAVYIEVAQIGDVFGEGVRTGGTF